MNELKEQCVNMLTDRIISNAFETGEVEQLLASLLIHGRKYSLSEWSLEELLDVVHDEYRDDFSESEHGKNDEVPERTRLENWIMEQDTPNWCERV